MNSAFLRGKIVSKSKVIEYAKRTAMLVVGLFVMSFWVALSIKASLGTSPISGIPYVLNLITGLSVGVTTIIVNVIIVLIQIPILRKKFRLHLLLQIPVCVVFGLLNDLALMCVEGLTVSSYPLQWLVCVCGIILVALGVSIEVTANVTTLPGEGLVLAICKVLPRMKFGYMKVAVDTTLVVIAAVLALVFLHELTGVREGTVAAAIFVGLLAKQFNKVIEPIGNKLFGKAREGKQPASDEGDAQAVVEKVAEEDESLSAASPAAAADEGKDLSDEDTRVSAGDGEACRTQAKESEKSKKAEKFA